MNPYELGLLTIVTYKYDTLDYVSNGCTGKCFHN